MAGPSVSPPIAIAFALSRLSTPIDSSVREPYPLSRVG